jgi:hypothetical protein
MSLTWMWRARAEIGSERLVTDIHVVAMVAFGLCAWQVKDP